MVNIARLCFGLNMLTTLPLEAFVCREVMFHYFMEGKPISTTLHVMVSTCLVVGSMLISLMVCDLGIVFELIGATSACALAYILPPLCYIKLSQRSWKTVPAVACVAFGFIVMVISVVQSVVKVIRSKRGCLMHWLLADMEQMTDPLRNAINVQHFPAPVTCLCYGVTPPVPFVTSISYTIMPSALDVHSYHTSPLLNISIC